VWKVNSDVKITPLKEDRCWREGPRCFCWFVSRGEVVWFVVSHGGTRVRNIWYLSVWVEKKNIFWH